MSIDWAALAKGTGYSDVWSMSGWHGLRWAMARGDGAGKPVPEKGRRLVYAALAAASRPVTLHPRGPSVVDADDGCRAEFLWGRHWSPAGLDALCSVSVSGLLGSYTPTNFTLGVLVGVDEDGESSFILLARNAPVSL